MFDVKLTWKSFNVSLDAIKTWIDNNIETECTGLSGDYSLQIHFVEEPSQEEKEAIAAYWENLEEEDTEATSYKSEEQIESDKQTKKQSAKSKLAALGLTEAEIRAILD